MAEFNHTITLFLSEHDFLNAVNEGKQFDIAVIDIMLKDSNGIDVAAILQKTMPNCQIIFISGYMSSMSAAYDVPHVWYVYKPEIDEKLPLAVKRAVSQCDKIAADQFSIKIRRRTIVINKSDAIYIEQVLRKSRFVCKNGEYDIYAKVSSMVEALDDDRFIVCHKSFAVNVDEVKTFDRSTVTMTNGKTLPISRSCLAAFSERLANRYKYIV